MCGCLLYAGVTKPDIRVASFRKAVLKKLLRQQTVLLIVCFMVFEVLYLWFVAACHIIDECCLHFALQIYDT